MSNFRPTIHGEDLLPAYAAGATDEREADQVSNDLAACEACQAALTEYEESLSVLMAAIPSVSPPGRVRAELMERLGSGARFENLPASTKERRGVFRSGAWLASGEGIAAGVLVGLGIGGWFAYLQLRDDLGQVEEIVGNGRVVSYLAATPQTDVMVLEAQEEAGEMADRAYAMLMAPPSGRSGVLVAGGMEALPRDKALSVVGRDRGHTDGRPCVHSGRSRREESAVCAS
jgi:anti-sigma-K factor RskA